MIVGFYLVMVTLLPDGKFRSEAVDYFAEEYDCYNEITYLLDDVMPDTNFTCIADYVVLPVQPKGTPS